MMERRRATGPDLTGVYESIHRLTVYGTLTFLVLVGGYLVACDFGRDVSGGVRSLAAALFPITTASFVFVFARELFEQLGEVPPGVSFLGSAGAGFVLMLMLTILGDSSALPLVPLLLSTCFAVLAFSSGSLRDNKALPYYYGAVSGLLIYVILFGFPLEL